METPLETIPDWLKIVAEYNERGGPELELDKLMPGDRLIVSTKHTHYGFEIISGRDAQLQTNRDNRPSGRVSITGCTFGDSSSIKPDHLFCGGNLEFTFERDGERRTQLTTTITALRHFRKK